MNSESTESPGVFEFLAWLEVNKKRLAILAAGIVVVGFSVYLFNEAKDQKEGEASDALLKLRTPLNNTNIIGPTAGDLLKVVNDFPQTRAGERAQLMAAGALFTDGKYAESHAEFGKFAQNYPNSSLNAAAAYGVAASLDAQKKSEEAVTAYQNVINRFPNDPVVSQTKLALGRLHEGKNQPEQAYKFYDEVAKNQTSSFSPDAMQAREQLVKKHPHLAKVNAPPAVSTNAAPALAPSSFTPQGASPQK